MLRVSLRNLLARKVRLLLSAFAIVLGVAFVAGSFVFTDTMGKSFDNIVEGSLTDATARLAGVDAGSTESSFNIDARTISAASVDKLAGTPGAARVDASIDGMGLFVVRKDGKLLGGTGAPTLAFNYTDTPNLNGDPMVSFAEGRAPKVSGEVAIDKRSADAAKYKLGDTVTMVTAGDKPRIKAKLVGYADFAGGGLAGATLVFFDTRTAQDIFLGGADAYTSVGLTAEPGVSQKQLAAAAQKLLPEGLEAVTGDTIAAEVKGIVDTALGFLNTFLLVFAAIALVVGTFLIINTFSILVAQRSRELALLRALGASRRQVTRAVLIEALAVGLIGSTLGLLAGFALAAGLKTLFARFGLDLSGTSLVFEPRTAIVAYAVGILVTLFAAYLPARRAAKIAPVAAMRDDVALPESSIHRRVVVGATLVAAGSALLGSGLFGEFDGNTTTTMVGGGILGVLIGVALLSPVLGRPVLNALGAVYRKAFGTVGNLATQNALRNPRRTAATASALMIGLALVTTMSVLGASINKSIDVGVKEQFTTDYLVSNAIGQPFSATIGEQIAEVDGVGQSSAQQETVFKIKGSTVYGTAVDSDSLNAIFRLKYLKGTKQLGPGEIALDEDAAVRYDAKVGDTVTLQFTSGDLKAKVVGIYESTYVVGSALIPLSTVTDAQLKRADSGISVNAAPGVDKKELGKRIEAVTKPFPTVTVQNQEDFAEAQRTQVNQLLYLIYALLGLAIIIAVLGIVNTLALSVIERTREVGLLRAVGLSRRQLRRMVRLEAIAIAVLGALLGVVMGIVFGVVLQRSASDQGITDLGIPWVRLLVFVLVSALVGILAAVLPARRAAKLNVLNAISTE
ncbi:MAG: ABC transporter permease [Aeromicrobium sp.]